MRPAWLLQGRAGSARSGADPTLGQAACICPKAFRLVPSSRIVKRRVNSTLPSPGSSIEEINADGSVTLAGPARRPEISRVQGYGKSPKPKLSIRDLDPGLELDLGRYAPPRSLRGYQHGAPLLERGAVRCRRGTPAPREPGQDLRLVLPDPGPESPGKERKPFSRPCLAARAAAI